MSSNILEVLLVDDEPELLDIIEVFIQSLYPSQVKKVQSGNEAIAQLKSGHKFDVVICDYGMVDGNGGDVYEFMQDNSIQTPFILVSTKSPSSFPEFADGKVAGYVNKPNIFEPLASLLGQIAGAPKSTDIEKMEERFVPVKIPLLRFLEVAPTNFYVRLGEGHAVKVIYKGSFITDADLDRYLKKGAEVLLFDALEAGTFAKAFCESAMYLSETEFVNEPGTVLAEYFSQSLHVVRDLSKEIGWPDELQNLVKQNMEIALGIVQNCSNWPEEFNKVFNFDEDCFGKHSAALTYVSVAMANSIGWKSQYTSVKLVMASMFHDITLTDHQVATKQDLLPMVGQEKFNDVEDVRAVAQHPIRSAAELRKIRGLPQGIGEIIEQHHENSQGTGFPAGLSPLKVSPLGALFIVAEDFVDYYMNRTEGKADLQEFLKLKDGDYTKGPFKEVFQGLSQLVQS